MKIAWMSRHGLGKTRVKVGVQSELRTYCLVVFILWLFNIAMENGPFIDGLPGFTYKKW